MGRRTARPASRCGEHRGRAAADDLGGPLAAIEPPRQQVGHEPAVPRRAVVGRQLDGDPGAFEVLNPGGQRGGPDAVEQGGRGRERARRRSEGERPSPYDARPSHHRPRARNGVCPIPPATKTAERSGGGPKPWPSGPQTTTRSPGDDRPARPCPGRSRDRPRRTRSPPRTRRGPRRRGRTAGPGAGRSPGRAESSRTAPGRSTAPSPGPPGGGGRCRGRSPRSPGPSRSAGRRRSGRRRPRFECPHDRGNDARVVSERPSKRGTAIPCAGPEDFRG